MATRSSAAGLLSAEQVGDLLIKPLLQMSVAATALGVVQLQGSSYRVPLVAQDPQAAWTEEGSEIAVSDPTISEVEVTPKKLAALTVVSNELAADSSPEAIQVIGDGIVRDLSRKLDAALFAASTPHGPAGLPSVTGVYTATAGTAADTIDALTGSQFALEKNGAVVQSWIASPTTAASIASIKRGTGSNEPLVTADVTTPGQRVLLGVPLLVSAAVPDGQVWGIDPQYSQLILRQDAEVEADSSPFFSSDRTAVRGIIRAGFAFTHPGGIAKVAVS